MEVSRKMTGIKVKYSNKLNTVDMSDWTAGEMDFFFAIIAKVRDKGLETITLDTNQLKFLTQYTGEHNERWMDIMLQTSFKVLRMTYLEEKVVDGEEVLDMMQLFSKFRLNPGKNTISVQVSENFEYIVNNLTGNFTTYELEEFTTIRSTYAKTMYRLLKQWRTVGKKEYSFNEFKQLMGCPSYYRSGHIDKNILKPIMKELPKYFKNLKIKKVQSNTRGKPVTGYIFTFTKEVPMGVYDENKYKPSEVVLPGYAKTFDDLLDKYGFFPKYDKERISLAKEVYPIYQKIVTDYNMQSVESHIKRVREYMLGDPDYLTGYLKKAVKDYLPTLQRIKSESAGIEPYDQPLNLDDVIPYVDEN